MKKQIIIDFDKLKSISKGIEEITGLLFPCLPLFFFIVFLPILTCMVFSLILKILLGIQ